MNTSNEVGYVDGFVLAVPKAKIEEYKKLALVGKELWLKYGALSYKECRLEAVAPEWVELTFGKLAEAGPDEDVWFSYIEFTSKEHRDEVNDKVMADPVMSEKSPEEMENMPFEMKRMAYGGFEVVV